MTSYASADRIAVIGAGISGMGAALRLAQHHAVTLFEAEPTLGGHARTRMAHGQPVDTGFIVFNYANYPHLTALFDEIDAPVVKSDMSFGASIDGGRYEYGLRSLGAVFAQKRNLLRASHWGMIRDVLRFNKHALRLADDPSLTVGGLLDRLGTGDAFRDHYLLPLSGAIWSTPTQKILDFPAYAMMQFFENHALLHHTGQHQWYTVEGGSRAYVSRLETHLNRAGVTMRLACPIEAVERSATGVRIRAQGSWQSFDQVVFATHSDDTLRLLSDPTEAERAALGAVRYQPNRVVLHSDSAVMPRRKGAWASWTYTEAAGRGDAPIDLTYWMNSLQPWLTEPTFVTLNNQRPIRPELIWDEVTLRHPVYDAEALEGQAKAAALNGTSRSWFCGAWMKNGFHEDGLSSAMDVVQALGAKRRAAA